jgi:hypothetical protein
VTQTSCGAFEAVSLLNQVNNITKINLTVSNLEQPTYVCKCPSLFLASSSSSQQKSPLPHPDTTTPYTTSHYTTTSSYLLSSSFQQDSTMFHINLAVKMFKASSCTGARVFHQGLANKTITPA